MDAAEHSGVQENEVESRGPVIGTSAGHEPLANVTGVSETGTDAVGIVASVGVPRSTHPARFGSVAHGSVGGVGGVVVVVVVVPFVDDVVVV